MIFELSTYCEGRFHMNINDTQHKNNCRSRETMVNCKMPLGVLYGYSTDRKFYFIQWANFGITI